MTQISIRFLFALSAAVALLLPLALPAQLTQPPVEELKRLVAQREQEFSAAQVALASARARLARAEGKSELAAVEWRKVIAHFETRAKEEEDRKPCSPMPLQEARGAVAVARVWLADMEGRRDELRALLPKVIEYYELRVQKYQSLRKFKAISEQEAEEALKELGEELQYARALDVHIALNDGMTDKAISLLKKDPTLIESRSADYEETPLHVAAHRGRVEAVKWLLDNKAKVNVVAYNKFTPLHLTQDGEIAKALIKAGADLDLKDVWGNTPLQMAAQGKHAEVVDAILASGYKLDLRTAVVLKKRDEVKKMLKDDPALAKKASKGSGLWGSNTPLGVACSQKDKEIVQLLLDAGADVNEGTNMPNAGGDATALTNAVWAGDKEIVELLLKRGAKTDVVGGKFYPTILDYARKHSSPEIVQLLEKGKKQSQ